MTSNDYQWIPMTIYDYQWLPMTTNDYQCLQMNTNDYQWLHSGYILTISHYILAIFIWLMYQWPPCIWKQAVKSIYGTVAKITKKLRSNYRTLRHRTLIDFCTFLNLWKKKRVGGRCPEKDTTGQELLMFAFSARPCWHWWCLLTIKNKSTVLLNRVWIFYLFFSSRKGKYLRYLKS